MRFNKEKFSGIRVIHLQSFNDERGQFFRVFCQKEFLKKKINFRIAQINISFNPKKGTLRGLHYQKNLSAEDKTIICRKGKIFFVAVNINKNSKNYLKCFTYILSSKKNVIINIKKGFATGFLTLEKNSEILYLMSNFYNKSSSLGINYKSDKININWPIKPSIISKKDRSLPSS